MSVVASGDRDRLQAVMEALPEAAVFQGLGSTVVAVNQRFVDIFGLAGIDTAPGAPLAPIVESVLAQYADPPHWTVGAAVASGATGTFRVHRSAEIPLADGRTILRTVEPLRLRGQLLGSLWTARDITEHKRAERDLERDNRALTELARRRNQFMASASHELRTPLSSIISFCELLTDPSAGNLGADQRMFLDAIHRNAERIRGVISDLLAATTTRSAQLELEYGEVRVGRMLEHAVRDHMPAAAEAGVFLTLDCAPGPPLRGDEHRLQQVVGNLLENAVKFTPRGGDVAVSAAPREEHWEIEVADTGIGVPEGFEEEIFQGFVRAPNALDDRYPGTGLGLAVSRDTVQLHGGTIGVASAAAGEGASGHGAVFRLRLPLPASDAARDPS
ncbi:PAS domain-containing sensor histidine kinase [Streptomyces varsoviensis]|uniref:PAS domain-containing sensor histidine kinase n=1 Tax=Streptomyces varsoviensis TaxID=67373 RepID=UPI0004C4BD71|nr:HAMP domain-containing sensor histidine kinase [Streptomyces varsoviensis]